MAKISNSEINALIRKLEAEIKPTDKEYFLTNSIYGRPNR